MEEEVVDDMPITPQQAQQSPAKDSARTIQDDPLSSYDVKQLLGEGAYGWVYSGVTKKSGDKVAIKKFKGISDDDEDGDYVIKVSGSPRHNSKETNYDKIF